MPTVGRVVFAIALLVNLGCSLHRPNLPWRTEDPATAGSANRDRQDCSPQPPNPPRRALDQLANDGDQATVRCASNEYYEDLNTKTPFDLHIVEFDDQGRFWNRQQVDQALLEVAAARQKGDVLVITFFHGWFNNADVCNGKLSCFRELLSLIAEAEVSDYRRQLERSAFSQESAPRRVIGIFGGWRGETLAVEGAKFVTFWGRKAAAHTVGENGAVTELVASLFGVVHQIPKGATVRPATSSLDLSSLVIIGHSFGGALVMSAIGNELSRAAGEALAERDGSTITVTNRMADLVVLINPAVEASRFDNLREAASTATFSDEQLPILVTLSSESDTPNQILFPIGQSLAFAQKAARSREQWQGMIQSLGTFRPNHTHQLIARGRAPSNQVRVVHCQCEAGIADYRDVLLDDLLAQVNSATATGDQRANYQQTVIGSRREYLYSRLEPMQDIDPNNPFFMVSVDDEIIGGHSDIFNPRTVDFLLEFLLRSEARRKSVRRSTPPASPRATPPSSQVPAPDQRPFCFSVSRSPDGPVSIVHLDETLPRRDRMVAIDYIGSTGNRRRTALRTQRFLERDERQFRFTFTQPGGIYVVTALDEASTVLPCQPFRHDVGTQGETTPTHAYIVVGLAEGLGAQLGVTLQVKRLVLEGSAIKKAGSSRMELTSDLGIGYRGNRSAVGVGHRWRHDFDEDQVISRSAYTHFTLELPGLRFLGQTWSSWMGLEFTPVEKTLEDTSWEWAPSFAVRFQIRLPRERWLSK